MLHLLAPLGNSGCVVRERGASYFTLKQVSHGGFVWALGKVMNNSAVLRIYL